ncbi:tetratricopeptide repeat protein [Nocardiopsis dassonvillei]|uniref:tetratricopeptide repeat protein n=1 Tax=Nocardiopsis dassonvillei TaxID=2014 RepID=UPI00367083B9
MSTAHRIVRLTGTSIGSGYVIAPRLVLTSAHVVPEPGRAVTFFTATDDTVYTGRVAWRGTPHGRDDAALVEITDPAWPASPVRVRWGRLVTHTPGIPCHTWGYPDVVQQAGQAVETSQPAGTINPGNHFVGNHHVMDITTHPPRWDGKGSPWGGLSGAALVCGDLVVGVVAADPAHSGHAQLEAVPAYVLHHDPAFRTALEEHGASRVLEPVELADLAHRQPANRRLSPASLLEAHRRVVSFHGREKLMDTLTAWCKQPDELSAVVVHGPGGQGKTRLAHELTHHLNHTTQGQRWATLWLTDTTDPAHLKTLARVQVPLLVVVDYAEARTRQLTDLLRVCERDPGSTSIRLLLLTRTVGEWWEQVNTDTGHLLADITEHTIALPSLAPARVDREHEYRTALHQLAGALPEADTPVTANWKAAAAGLATPELSAAEWNTVLSVHMRALTDLLDATQPPPQAARAGRSGPVEARVLVHERAYWKRSATGYGIQVGGATPEWQNTVLEQVLAVAFTCAPATVEKADALLSAIPVLADQTTALRQQMRQWICALYPNEGAGLWGTVQPDRLLEHFLADQLTKNPGLFDSHMEDLAEEDAHRWVSLYTRAAAHPAFAPNLGEQITRLCVHHALVLGAAAVDVATHAEHPEPLVEALRQIVHDSRTPLDALIKLNRALPHFSHRLAEWAAQVSIRLVETRRKQDQEQPGVHLPSLATSLHNQAVRLGDLGQHEKALSSSTEAVRIRQSLAQRSPDAYLPDLAKSLHNKAVDLSNLGQHEMALETISRAVRIRRKLAQKDPDNYMPALADSLNSLGNRLGDLGRVRQALEPLSQAVRIRRNLTRQRPDIHLANLAASLNNLAARLVALGRGKESLTAINEAVRIRRTLAQRNPDAHLPELATSLNNQALDLGDLGRHKQALTVMTEAVLIRRKLAHERPDAYLPDLATSLHNQASLLGTLERHEEALVPIAEAIKIRQTFARMRPAAHLAKLRKSHDLHAQLKEQGGEIHF